MVFTNWLLMYLTDIEIEGLVKNSLGLLEEGGYFFIRESCFHPSGNRFLYKHHLEFWKLFF